MMDMTRQERDALDTHLTGHYGEDQFGDDVPDEIEMTVRVTVRLRVPSGATPREVERACLEHVHGQPGYMAANARFVRSDSIDSPHPYPLAAIEIQ